MTFFKCDKCGHRSENVKVDYTTVNENGYDEQWISISCKKCNYGMWYNGA